MKSLKFVVIAVLLTFSVVNIAKSDGFGTIKAPKNVISITLQQAVQNPGLVVAMKDQLNPGFLNSNQQYYTVSVNYMQYTFKITGTYQEWKSFFSPKWGSPTETVVTQIGPSID
jgi:hypothetical protein